MRSHVADDGFEHLLRQATRVRIVARAMVAIEQMQPTWKLVAGTVAEQTGTAFYIQGFQDRAVGHQAKGKQDAEFWHGGNFLA